MIDSCPTCGEETTDEVALDVFMSGNGIGAKKISVAIPIIICSVCQLQYSDERAEKIRQDAVDSAWKDKE